MESGEQESTPLGAHAQQGSLAPENVIPLTADSTHPVSVSVPLPSAISASSHGNSASQHNREPNKVSHLGSSQRPLIVTTRGWLLLLTFFLLATASTLVVLNTYIYSAGGFVRGYLDSLGEHNAQSALSFPGVLPHNVPSEGSNFAAKSLLRDSLFEQARELREENVTTDSTGNKRVTFSYLIGKQRQSSEFFLTQEPSLFGIFPQWRFSQSPLARLTVTVSHDSMFSLKKVAFDTRVHETKQQQSNFSHTAHYLAFAPGFYRFSNKQNYVTSKDHNVSVAAGAETSIHLDSQPTKTLEDAVQTELNTYLNKCIKQEVLQPAGCPLGTSIANRVVGTPKWSILSYPKITLKATEKEFVSPKTGGRAHISVPIQSLFDGTTSVLERDVPIDVSIGVTTHSQQIAIRLY